MTDVAVTGAPGSRSPPASYISCPRSGPFRYLDRIERADHGRT